MKYDLPNFKYKVGGYKEPHLLDLIHTHLLDLITTPCNKYMTLLNL